MKFRTEIKPIDYPERIDLKDKVLTIGSCFSDTIGQKLAANKLDCLVNPFGNIYDPLSISRLLSMALEDQLPGDDTMVETNGVWKNLLIHSELSGLSMDELSLQIKARMTMVKKYLISADWLMLTFGTAFVYRYKETNRFVANCQKLPAANFKKELLSTNSLIEDFDKCYASLKSHNPNLKIILTVSPIRHVRDGLTENSVSKSILRIFCNSLSRGTADTYYYPSYEIMNDDLRDYRFYKEDLIHPNNQANTYIWEHFRSSFFTQELSEFIFQWHKISAGLQHRPFNPESKGHQKFLQNLLLELEALPSNIDLSKEIAQVRNQIVEDNR